MKEIIPTNPLHALSSVVMYIICAVITGIVLAFGMSYFYNDFNTIMEFGLPIITHGQMYLGLIALGAFRLWFFNLVDFKQVISTKSTMTQMWKLLAYKLAGLLIVYIVYSIVKFIIF